MTEQWWYIAGIILIVFVIVKVVSVRAFFRWWKRRDADSHPMHDEE